MSTGKHIVILTALMLARPVALLANEPIDIGSRRELFVDQHLIDRMDGAQLVLHRPQPREVAMTFDQPWETHVYLYLTVLQDDDVYRIYYGAVPDGPGPRDQRQVTCYAESKDGIHWMRPELGLVEFQGSKGNNIIGRGVSHHCFTPFKDANPNCPPEARYKAVGGPFGGPLRVFQSPDGIRWKLVGHLPLEGNFDSQNVVFWDSVRKQYHAYWRDHRVDDPKVPFGRDVRTARSRDFVNWTERQWLDYSPNRSGSGERDQTDDPSGDHHQFYTNGIQPYHRAPHLLLGFPQRYVDRGWTASTDALPNLKRRRELAAKNVLGGRPTREGTAITDVMFMASRDGQRFFVWPEAIVRPGIQRPGSWFYDGTRNAWGLVETSSSIDGAPRELSMYITENARQKTPRRVRRHTFRIDGFSSVHASLHGGELLTKPLIFDAGRLEINFATSAGGSLRVEIQDKDGKPFDGFTLADCNLQYGDQLDRVISWRSGADVSKLVGKPARLRIELKDADLYSFQFTTKE